MPIPEFIAHIRTKVGHDLLFLPGVSAVVRDDGGRILLVRRSDNRQWADISGILEPGEQPAEGILREILEETGVVARVEALAAVETTAVMSYPNGDLSQYVDTVFLCSWVSGEPHPADDESVDVGWFYPDQLPQPFMELAARRLHHVQTLIDNPGIGPYYKRPPS